MIRGHDLCFDKTCQGNRLALRAVAGCENGSNNDRTVVCCHAVSRLDLWNIVLSTVVYEICLAESDTVLVFRIYLGVFGDGTCLAMLKTICAPDSSSLKPGSGATEGVLD